MRCLPESFIDVTWRGTTNTDGILIGVSFNREDGSIVRLALPVASARAAAESILDYLNGYAARTNSQSASSSGSESVDVSLQRE